MWHRRRGLVVGNGEEEDRILEFSPFSIRGGGGEGRRVLRKTVVKEEEAEEVVKVPDMKK